MKARLNKAMAIPATNTRCRLRLMLQIGFLDRGVDVGAVVDAQPIQAQSFQPRRGMRGLYLGDCIVDNGDHIASVCCLLGTWRQ